MKKDHLKSASRRRRLFKLATCTGVCASLLAGCASSGSGAAQTAALTSGMNFKKTDAAFSTEDASAINAFSLQLFRNLNKPDENVLLSGASAWMALGMAANGASEETLSQMEEVLGLDRDQINKAASAFFSSLEDQNSLSMADSIWLKDTFKDEVSKDFLQTCAGDFRADVFASALDQDSVKEINDWTSEHTDGRIKEFLNSISEGTQMMLINAEAFEGAWSLPFEEKDTKKQTFHNQEGSESTVDFLNGTADWFVQNDDFTGFIKEYDESKYGYLLLLPNNKNQVLDEAAKKLDEKTLAGLLDSRESSDVEISMPKLNQECAMDLNDALKASGITYAFSPDADFSTLTGSKNDLYISTVLQKTFIEVNEKGTKAAAATDIGLVTTSLPVESEPVHADRPYFYMIVDLENSLPLFMGKVVKIEE